MPRVHEYVADVACRPYEDRLHRGLDELLLLYGRTYKDFMATGKGRISVWEFLMRVDDLRSTEAAAILSFAGIMLAADLVLLSAGAGSCVEVKGSLAIVAFSSAIALGISAIFGLLSFAVRFNAGGNSQDYVRLLGSYLFHIDYRRRVNYCAKFTAIAGVIIFLCAFVLKLFSWNCWA